MKQNKEDGLVGGLIGLNSGATVLNSYATGSVMAGKKAWGAAGFMGADQGGARQSYSTGEVKTGGGGTSGGFAGLANATFITCDWDITTSGTDQGTGGGNVDGLTGLTDELLKSGLPSGFDPTVWAQNPRINNGYPYLIENPPPK